jgi:hypothetical protein
VLKLVLVTACLAGLAACSYTQRDVALVPTERQVITTVPAPPVVTTPGSTVYHYEEYKNNPWLPY